MWEEHRIEDVASPEGFARDPGLVQRFYNERRKTLQTVRPNAAHIALAEFETRARKAGRSFTLVTQNIDDLHERGGSRAVLHMHGELLKARCESARCEAVEEIRGDLGADDSCPRCGAKNRRRPHIVWFGEMPFFLDSIQAALARCDLFVSIGTSGNVYPAAGFVAAAKSAGARCIELNLEPSAGSDYFDESILGPATRITPDFFTRLPLSD